MVIKTDAVWDLSIHDRNDRLVLIVEIKRKTQVSLEWATTLRQNLLAQGTFPKAPYFLMVFPDRFYLWDNANAYEDQSEPSYTIDAFPILQPYCERAGVTADQISKSSLEIMIISWLEEIMQSDQLPKDIDVSQFSQCSQEWLVESGLYAALVGGKFKAEVAA